MKEIKTKIICLIAIALVVIGSMAALVSSNEYKEKQNDDDIPRMQLDDVEINFMRAGQWLWYPEGHKQ